MWGQSWGNIADIVKPYPKKPSIDVTDEMVKQGWTQQKMFEKADDFFVSMGMTKVRSPRNCICRLTCMQKSTLICVSGSKRVLGRKYYKET